MRIPPNAFRRIRPGGNIMLAGGAEFGGRMAEPDRRCIALAGGFESRVCIIPAAAAPDGNHERAGSNGQRWFQQLGARNTVVVPLIDRHSAADPAVTAALRKAQLIYLLGGFPGHLERSLSGTPAWEAIADAVRSGALIAGSSAGAMVLCGHYFDPEPGRIRKGLDLLPGCCVLPHHDRFGHRWATRLQPQIPTATLIGIDEETGLLIAGDADPWRVYGAGAVTVYRRGTTRRFETGALLRIE